MVLDVTRPLRWRASTKPLSVYSGPVLASHDDCRALVPGYRQFTDDQIRRLLARDAVIGAACDSWMLLPDLFPDKRTIPR